VVQRTTQSIVVAAAPSAVYSVVADFDRYCDWVAELKSIDVVERDTDGRALEVAFRAAAFGRSTKYSLRYDYSRAPDTLSWHQSSGDVTREMRGSYSFLPRGAHAQETTVTYELEVELAVPVPQFIQSRATYRIQRQALSELKHRVEELS
jgi:ribosome-associated toxin RatA of RatAB toxin-antitoxin module